MNCKKCGNEVDKKAVVCPNCGCKIKKPIFKKIWFWVLILIVVISVAVANGNDAPESGNENTAQNQSEEIVYEAVDLQAMFNELDENAMKAKANYEKKYVEFQCKINNFDSNGSYISVEPVGASEFNLATAMCYIKNDTQKDFLIQKNVGDTITIKGKVKSIGEVLGYSFDINEVQ